MSFEQRELRGRGTPKRPNDIAKTANPRSASAAMGIITHKPPVPKSLSADTAPHLSMAPKITPTRTTRQDSSARTAGINTRHGPMNATINKRKSTALLPPRRNSRPTPSSLSQAESHQESLHITPEPLAQPKLKAKLILMSQHK